MLCQITWIIWWVLPRSLSFNVQLYGIEAGVDYFVGTINMFIRLPSLLAKLQRTITKHKRKLSGLSSLCGFVNWSFGNFFLTCCCPHSPSHFHAYPQKWCVVRSGILGTSQCHTSLSLPSFPQHKSFCGLHLKVSFGKLVSLDACAVSMFLFN